MFHSFNVRLDLCSLDLCITCGSYAYHLLWINLNTWGHQPKAVITLATLQDLMQRHWSSWTSFFEQNSEADDQEEFQLACWVHLHCLRQNAHWKQLGMPRKPTRWCWCEATNGEVPGIVGRCPALVLGSPALGPASVVKPIEHGAETRLQSSWILWFKNKHLDSWWSLESEDTNRIFNKLKVIFNKHERFTPLIS